MRFFDGTANGLLMTGLKMINQPDRILLVDDDSLGRLLTRSALEERGFLVCEAECGEVALDQIVLERPDIVLLDALMSGMDGFEVCRALRELPGGQHIPVLMLTGLDDEGSVSKAYAAGANDFFVKSTQWTLLAERIRYLLRANRTQAELVKSESRVAKAQRIAGLGIWEWDLTSNMIFPSQECFELIDIAGTDKGLHYNELLEVVHKAERISLVRIFQSMKKDQASAKFDCRLRGRDGTTRVVHIEAEVEYDSRGRAIKVHGILQDITDRREAEDRIRHLANYDSLTGLPNRRLFREQLGAAVERARRDRRHLAVLFVDIDNFKRINDTLGHHAGDALLNEVAYRLSNCVRNSDVVTRDVNGLAEAPNLNAVARLGGDEFTVLLDQVVNAENTDAIANRILKAVQQPVMLSGQECFVSVSIGIAMYPGDGLTVDEMIRNADLAMYAAKEAGRNGAALYTPQLDAATHRKLEISNALHKALERGELRLHYQPQFDISTGKIIAAEALMRWQRGERLVPPDEFIPMACETGLILPMGDWAIREACEQVARWRDAGKPVIPIAVNVSANAFLQHDFVAKVKASLASVNVAASFLEIEITETMLMQDLKQSVQILEELADFGVRLSVDDFGTGYSSLSYLRKLPIDTLKIDRSFVGEMYEGSDDEAIVSAIVALARALNLRVIAEGVETLAQANLLNLHGCYLMQGYFYSRPLAIAAFDEFVAKKSFPAAQTKRHKVVSIQAKKIDQIVRQQIN